MARPKKDPNPKPPGPGDGPMPVMTASALPPDYLNQSEQNIKDHLLSPLERLVDEGLCIRYVKFLHQPVPTGVGKEPVWEFKLTAKDQKYVVNSMFRTAAGVVFNAHGQMHLVELGNVSFTTPV